MNTMKSRSAVNQFGDNSTNCICERKQTNLICMDCRLRLFGRVHKVCQKHPTVSSDLEMTNKYLFFCILDFDFILFSKVMSREKSVS